MSNLSDYRQQWNQPPPAHFSNPHGIIGCKQTPSQVVASITPNALTWDSFPQFKFNYTQNPNVTIETIPLPTSNETSETVDMEID